MEKYSAFGSGMTRILTCSLGVVSSVAAENYGLTRDFLSDNCALWRVPTADFSPGKTFVTRVAGVCKLYSYLLYKKQLTPTQQICKW